MASLLNDPKLEALLDRLHAQSNAEVGETDAYFERREREGSLDYENFCDDDMEVSASKRSKARCDCGRTHFHIALQPIAKRISH